MSSGGGHRRSELRRAVRILAEGGDAVDGVRSADREGAERAYRRHASWRDQPEVVGLGVGRKRTDGEPYRRLAVVIGVERKLPRAKCTNPVPKTITVPGVEGRIPTDVLELGRIRPQHDPRLRRRPARGGASIGHPAVPNGTLGGLVTIDGEPGVYVLSAAHVLADYGRARPGDVIEQPGRADQVGAGDPRFAKLVTWIPYIFSKQGYPNRADAAIARVPANLVRPEVVHIGRPGGNSSYIREGMLVRKTGRTTDYSVGEVINADWGQRLGYPHPSGRHRRIGFGNQVLCTRFTEPGDSGAFVFNHEDKVVGLHLAGSSRVSVFSRIDAALGPLRATLIT